MRRLSIVLLILISFPILAVEIQAVFVDYNKDIGVVKRFEVDETIPVVFSLFQQLYSPPPGLRSFVPPECLRAAFVLDDAVVLDFYSDKLEGMTFYAERMAIYQILLSVFRTFDVSRVYIIKDGKKAKVFSKYADISLSFGRKEWIEWPVR